MSASQIDRANTGVYWPRLEMLEMVKLPLLSVKAYHATMPSGATMKITIQTR